MTPSQIVKFLDQHMVGQEEAKHQLAVAIYTHYKKIEIAAPDKVEIVKSNVLLIGPTGTGKTLLCNTLAQVLKVPFVTANATSLAQSEYVNDEIEAILQRLIDKAEGDVARAQRGIVFIDEIDKLKSSGSQQGHSRATSGEGVQHALLKIMEGVPVKLRDGSYIDTTQILFICGGAFVGLDEILSSTHTFGFISTTDSDKQSQKLLDRLNARVKPNDLLEFGLVAEFAGRLPIVAMLKPLTREMMIRIMTEPQNAIYRQYQQILKNEGVDLRIEPLVFEQIADLAMEYKVGARSLRGIFEEMLTPVMYLVPDHKEVRQVAIASLFESPRYMGSHSTN